MKKRPVIAVITDSIWPYHHGGKEQLTHNLVQSLSMIADVDIYTMKWWPEDTQELRIGDNVVLRAISPRLNLYNGERRSMLQAIVFALCCIRLVRRKYDAIEVDSIPVLSVLTVRLITVFRRVPMASFWYEVWGRDYWKAYLGPLGWLANLLEIAGLHCSSHVLATSIHTAERAGEILKGSVPVTLAMPGINMHHIHESARIHHEADLITVGRLLNHKRVDMAISAVAELHARGGKNRLLVIGNGPELDRLRAHATELKIASFVEFRTDVETQAELYGLMHDSSVFVFPSEREGFGIAPLEAMACGVPVVTTSAPDNASQHLVRDVGLGEVVEPTVTGLADGIMMCLRVSYADAMKTQGAQSAIRRYDWSTIAATVAEVLECT